MTAGKAKSITEAPKADGPGQARPPLVCPQSPFGEPTALQQAGNQAVQHFVRGIAISQPSDPEEREADLFADQVMCNAEPVAPRPKCAEQEATRRLESTGASNGNGRLQITDRSQAEPAAAPIPAPRGGGQLLPQSVRALLEPRLRRDLSGVQIHTEEAAAAKARAISARAFAFGADIYFAAGEYQPDTEAGRRLLAHELSHVAQEGGPPTIRRQVPAAATPAPADPVQAGPASFDAQAVDVAGMGNETLNAETLRVDDWFASHSTGDPDTLAYETLRGRLRAERTRRVQLGHAWMSQVSRALPTRLYMIAPGAGGRRDIIAVDLVQAFGVPNQTPAGPIMTEDQYRAYLMAANIPEVGQQTYDSLRAAQQSSSSANPATPDDANPSAAGGPGPARPPATPVLAMYFPPGTTPQQPGGMTIHHGTSQSGYEGFSRGIDLSGLQGEGQDFSRGLYAYTNPDNAVFGAGVRATQRGEGGMRHVLQWELNPQHFDVVDIRPGGPQRALWEQFLQEPPSFAGPGSPVEGQAGFRSNAAYLAGHGIEQRGVVFEEFLARHGLQHADVIIGELGTATTSGALAPPGGVSEQVVIRSQRAADVLNAQMRGEPTPGGADPTGGRPTRPGGAGGIAAGGAAGGIIAVLTTVGWMYFDASQHPDWAEELAASGGQGTLAGATQATIEQAILSGGGRLAPQIAPEVLGTFARGGGAGVLSAGFEIYGISQERRAHSGVEVGVRVGRSAAIGVASTEIGVAASAGLLAVMFGTAAEGAVAGSVVPGWGTAIGFIAGLAVGAAAFYALDKAVPGGREDWDPNRPAPNAPAREADEPRSYFCFTADTRVTLADGSSQPIRTIRPGERVLAVPDGEVESAMLRACIVDKVLQYAPAEYLLLSFDDGTVLRVTPNHPLFAEGGWRAAGELRAGDAVAVLDGSRAGLRRARVSRVAPQPAELVVYDLVVADCHTFFANGVLAHNKNI
jgi:Domain of unknown function (DUF4157)/Pretoxin HINT domain